MRSWLRRLAAAGVVFMAMTSAAFAGPPFLTDDPQPTDLHHYEIYSFAAFDQARGQQSGAAGLDFNYGAAENLQLTAVLPYAFTRMAEGRAGDLGPIELAAKYKILHQTGFGLDVAIFPRIFLPAGSAAMGPRHAALLLPIWVGKDFGKTSVFGGGGCTINRGGGSQDFCQWGLTATHKITDRLTLGAEVFHQTPDARHGRASTDLGFGGTYDLSERLHLMATLGPGVQNRSETSSVHGYIALLTTF